MGYINYEPVTVTMLTCNHPRVKRIWEYGGGSLNPSDGILHRFVSILLDNEERHEFKDNGDGKAVEDAEEFLKSI